MNYYDYSLLEHTSLVSPKGTYCLKVYEISWCFYWEYMLQQVSINSDPIHREYMITQRSHL